MSTLCRVGKGKKIGQKNGLRRRGVDKAEDDQTVQDWIDRKTGAVREQVLFWGAGPFVRFGGGGLAPGTRRSNVAPTTNRQSSKEIAKTVVSQAMVDAVLLLSASGLAGETGGDLPVGATEGGPVRAEETGAAVGASTLSVSTSSWEQRHPSSKGSSGSDRPVGDITKELKSKVGCFRSIVLLLKGPDGKVLSVKHDIQSTARVFLRVESFLERFQYRQGLSTHRRY